MAKRRGGRGAAIVAALALAGPASGQVSTQELACIIQPSAVVRLSTAEPGLIARVAVERGAEVRAGDVVAELVSDVEATAVALARARAEDASDVLAAQSRAEMLTRRLERSERLRVSAIVSESALDEMRTELLVARQDLEAARARQVQAALELRRAEQMLARRVILSPVSGLVTERLKSPGEYFTEQDHVAVIAVLDPLYVESFAPVALWGRIAEGDLATVRPEPPVGGAHAATVTVVDRVLDAASGTYGVRLVLPNPAFAVPAGVNCTVAFGPAPD